MSIEIIGEKELFKNLDGLSSGMEDATKKALMSGGLLVQADAIKSISQGSAQGKTYKRGSVTHRASAPGDAPASDTGRLTKKITIRSVKESVFVGSNLLYARFLELGTSSIQPRPFLVPALEKNRRHIGELIKAANGSEIKRRTK